MSGKRFFVHYNISVKAEAGKDAYILHYFAEVYSNIDLIGIKECNPGASVSLFYELACEIYARNSHNKSIHSLTKILTLFT